MTTKIHGHKMDEATEQLKILLKRNKVIYTDHILL